MRTDTNKIALRAIRNLLAGAKPFEVDAGATKVTCSMAGVLLEQWPTGAEGLIELEEAGGWQRRQARCPVPCEQAQEVVPGARGCAQQGNADGLNDDTESEANDLPLNLILYGPPGTGKTHRLTNDLVKKFQRKPTKTDTDTEIAEDLTWTQLTAIALYELGGKAKVAALEQHPLIRAKQAAGPTKCRGSS